MYNKSGITTVSATNVRQILSNVELQNSVGVVVDDAGTTVNSYGKKIVKAGTPLAGSLDARITPFTKASEVVATAGTKGTWTYTFQSAVADGDIIDVDGATVTANSTSDNSVSATADFVAEGIKGVWSYTFTSAPASGKVITLNGISLIANSTSAGSVSATALLVATISDANFTITTSSGQVIFTQKTANTNGVAPVLVVDGTTVTMVAGTTGVSPLISSNWDITDNGSGELTFTQKVANANGTAPVIKLDGVTVTAVAGTTPVTTVYNSNAIGVLLHDVDVTQGDANGSLLTFGFVNTNRLESDVQALITTAVKEALNGKVTFMRA